MVVAQQTFGVYLAGRITQGTGQGSLTSQTVLMSFGIPRRPAPAGTGNYQRDADNR